jgi:transposase-like protein
MSRELGVTRQTVGKWRQRFLDQRLDGLLDESASSTFPSKGGNPAARRVPFAELGAAPSTE